MIRFKILRAQDSDLIGEHLYHFNRITLAKSEQSTLVVEDTNMAYLGLIIEVINDGVLVNTLPVGNYYLSNNKKIAGTKKHKAGDRIEFGSTSLEILEFKEELQLVHLSLEERYQRATKDERVKELLEVLEKEIIELEREP
jgi:hypothetical protein